MIKISIDRPQLRDGGPLQHSGTSWQISRIPDFSDRTYYLAESLDDHLNLLEFRHVIDLDPNESIYCRVKYHFNNDTASGWSRVIPVKGDQIGIKQSGTVIMTPKVKVNVTYTGDVFTNLVLETNAMSLYSGVGEHDSTTWSVTDSDNNIIWKREHEKRDITKIEIGSDILDPNKIYIVKAVHHTNTNAHSNSGRALLSTNINSVNIYNLEAVGPLVPDRLLYFKLFVYLNNFESIDIVIRDRQGVDVVSNLNQVTRTPRIHPKGLIPYQRYTIYARIKYDGGKYTNYMEVSSHIVEHNVLLDISPTATYLDKYNYTQELRANGEVVSSTMELYTNDVLMAKANDDNIYRHVICNGKLVDKGPVITLDGMKELMDKPYINIVPLHDGRVLIDYNSVRMVHIDNAIVPENIRSHMIANRYDTYDYETITIVRDKELLATDDIYGDDLVYRPRFSLYDFNTVTNQFTLLNTVMRDDELYGTAITNSIVSVEDGFVYYIPTHSVNSVTDITLNPLVLRKLNLEDMSIATASELPVEIMSHPTLFKVNNNTLVFMSGSDVPDLVNNIEEYTRSNSDIFEYDLTTGVWDNVGSLAGVAPGTMYALAPYTRRDGLVVLFNNVNSGLSRGDQRTILYEPVSRQVIINDNDSNDSLTYRNTIQLLNGDMLRMTTRVIDPQLVQTYVSDTYAIEDLHTNDIFDVVNNLVVRVGDVVTVETLYKFDSITIEGDSEYNTGKLVLLDGNSSTEFRYNDLIVIGDLAIEQDIYLNNFKDYDTITVLDGSSLDIYNVLNVPDDTDFLVDAPISVREIRVGNNSNLIINIPNI